MHCVLHSIIRVSDYTDNYFLLVNIGYYPHTIQVLCLSSASFKNILAVLMVVVCFIWVVVIGGVGDEVGVETILIVVDNFVVFLSMVGIVIHSMGFIVLSAVVCVVFISVVLVGVFVVVVVVVRSVVVWGLGVWVACTVVFFTSGDVLVVWETVVDK